MDVETITKKTQNFNLLYYAARMAHMSTHHSIYGKMKQADGRLTSTDAYQAITFPYTLEDGVWIVDRVTKKEVVIIKSEREFPDMQKVEDGKFTPLKLGDMPNCSKEAFSDVMTCRIIQETGRVYNLAWLTNFLTIMGNVLLDVSIGDTGMIKINVVTYDIKYYLMPLNV